MTGSGLTPSFTAEPARHDSKLLRHMLGIIADKLGGRSMFDRFRESSAALIETLDLPSHKR